jgi:hypothetical protein
MTNEEKKQWLIAMLNHKDGGFHSECREICIKELLIEADKDTMKNYNVTLTKIIDIDCEPTTKLLRSKL